MEHNPLPDELKDAFTSRGFPLVQFDRRPFDRHVWTAFALSWNKDVTLAQIVDASQFRLNGCAVLLNHGAMRWRSVYPESIWARASVLHRLKPQSPPDLNIESMRAAIDSASQPFPLLAIYRERQRRDSFSVAGSARTTRGSVKFRSLSPGAEWEEHVTLPLKDVTRIDFGCTYLNLLAKMTR